LDADLTVIETHEDIQKGRAQHVATDTLRQAANEDPSMAEKQFHQVSFFSPEFIDPTCLSPGTVPWVLARFGSSVFPAWLFNGWSKDHGRGRDAWSPLVLMSLLMLRFLEAGMSRRAAVRRAKSDLVWCAAMGLVMGGASPSETTVRRFEAFLAGRDERTGILRYLLVHEHLVRLCLQDEQLVLASAWATDSTPMWCYGAVRDTVRLLGDGIVRLARRYARLRHIPVEQLASDWQLPLLLSKSVKGHYRIDWSDRAQRSEVIEELAEDVVRVVERIRSDVESLPPKHRKDLLRRCSLLLRVVEQDLETDETGRLVVAKRVVKDRIVSLTEPQARHGRKSKSQTFNGFKLHLVGDLVSGLIASIAVTGGNQHDGKPAVRLIRRARQLCDAIELVLADTAYGGAELRYVVRKSISVELIAPPPSVRSKDNGFSRNDFDIEIVEKRATCPRGRSATGLRMAWSKDLDAHQPVFTWNKQTCAGCEAREACIGKRSGGKFLAIHPYESEVRRARELWDNPDVRELYRARSQCERLINQVVRHGGRQARSFGLQSAQLQAHVIAIRCNLALFAKQMLRAQELSVLDNAA
jgi:hypothetical protein